MRRSIVTFAIVLVATLVLCSTAHASSITFTSSGTFIVPNGVTMVDVLVMGGGGGGANGHQGGGGAGYVGVGTYAVTPGDMIAIIVGFGGLGANDCFGCNEIIGLTPGGASSFGTYLTASGGKVVTGINQGGQNGSSGGGGSCNSGPLGGAGGSGGSDGQPCVFGGQPFGMGQGNYVPLLALFDENILTAGAGGAGGTGTHAGGGGGGGILINGLGPSGGDGSAAFSARGGLGYGAGGGAGGYDGHLSPNRFAGGDGANGLVYLEFEAANVPELPLPASLLYFGTAVAGLLSEVRRRRQKQ
jgi:hypothetical protein